MKLLIVTPTLGNSPWLAETIASVANLSAHHVVVAPRTTQDALSKQFPRIVLVDDPGNGMYGAINAGIAHVPDWDAFTYINDDDLLLPDFARVMKCLHFSNRPLIAYGGVRLIDSAGRRLGSIPISPDPALNRHLYAERLEPVYQHGTIVSRGAMDQLGGFDATLRFCGDSEFLARACMSGVPFHCATRREVAAFRLRAGQLTKNRVAMVAERAAIDTRLRLLSVSNKDVSVAARRRFRVANARIYLERILRHGFVSFDSLLERGGVNPADR